MSVRIHRLVDFRNLAFKDATGIGHYLDLNRLAQVKKRELTFADIRQHPFDRHVGDRVRRRWISRLNEKSGLRILVCDFAGYWTAYDQGGIGLA